VSKTFLKKRQVAQRYGGVTPRSVERAVVDGRIPAPEYPFGPHRPMWDLAKLEENERAAAIRGGKLQAPSPQSDKEYTPA
jgi:hypothetical protein